MNDRLRTDSISMGYLIPEFPGQTHGFFWRELGVLEQLQVSPDVVSTRRPRRKTNHDWEEQSQAATTYLADSSIPALLSILGEFRNLPRRRLAAILRIACEMSKEGSRSPYYPARVTAFAEQLLWLALGARLSGISRKRGWQHVHVHSCGNSAYIALYARLFSGLPYSITLHGPLSDYGHNQVTKWANAAFAIVITEQLQAEVRRSLGSGTPNVLKVIPMGVDVNQFSRRMPYAPWTASGVFRVFSCGRLNPSKGHNILLAAMHSMVANGADVVLTIAGEDEEGGHGYRRELERTVDKLNLRDRVRLLGAVPTSVIQKELGRAHAFTLASHAEPLGVAIMEAMCMEVPVVATAAGGVSELVLNGRTGLLVDPGDPESLALALHQLMDNPELCVKLGEAGRQRVTASYGHRRSAEALAQLMRTCKSSSNSMSASSHVRNN